MLDSTYPTLGEYARSQVRDVSPAKSRRVYRKREKRSVARLVQGYLR